MYDIFVSKLRFISRDEKYISQNNQTFLELKPSARAAVHTCCVMDACNRVQSIILLPYIVRNIDGWLHRNKISSFEMKSSIVATSEYMNNLKIPFAS